MSRSEEKGTKRGRDADETGKYPRELKEMLGPLECKLCSVTATSTLTMYTHYKGKTHRKKLDRYLRDNNITLDEPLDKKTKIEFTPSTCKTCNVILTSELQSLQHYAGKAHKKKVAAGVGPVVPVAKEAYDPTGRFGIGKDFTPKAIEPLPVPSAEKNNVLFCGTCNVFTTSSEALTAHMLGAKHRKRAAVEDTVQLNSLAKYRTPSDSYYCPACDVSANSPQQFLFHIKNKKHLNKTKEPT